MNNKDRQQRLDSMTDVEYFNTLEWETTRERVLSNCRFRCHMCGGYGPLQVCIKGNPRRGNETDDDLVVLCVKCNGIY